MDERSKDDGDALELSAVAWRQPHRGWGELVELMVLEEGVFMFCQSLRHAQHERGVPWCDEEKPFRKRVFELSLAADLRRGVERLEIQWPAFQPILGGANLGLFVEHCGVQLWARWNSLQQGDLGPVGELHRWIFALSQSE